ncbi:TPM domain-containing protein [Gordonia caeni]|uniref:TPM domain-containing protein n=1 Tax=Gordonia caeni TaxID=1007097 RepID=A0ABP7NKK1_9ACTN
MTLARRRLTALPALSLLAAMLVALLVSAPAAADVPTQMPAQVVDAADVLTVDQEDEITAAVERLSADRDVQLWVIYVHDFGGMSPGAWARQTEQLSEMSYRDVLLAVAVDDRTFHLGSAEPIDDYPASALQEIAGDTVAPAVRDSRWTEAAMSTVDDLSGTRSRTWLWVTIAVLVVAALACLLGAYLYRRNRSGQDGDGDDDDTSDLTVAELTAQPLSVLEPWSTEALLHTDNAVSVSGDELALAEREYGETATAPFRDALNTAESAVATSFRLRRRLDEEPGPTAGERRSLLVQIISMCSDADGALDDRVADFDALRDLLSDAGDRLDALAERADALADRQRGAVGDEASLTERFTGPVVDSVAGNGALAGDLLQFAADSVAQGREAVADRAERRQPTVAAIRSAECALDAAGRLLDALADVGQNLVVIAEVPGGPEVATAYVAAAESFIDTRRGAVGCQARACLSEAERLLDEAQSSADAQEATTLSDAATALAEQALALGAQDVAEWRIGQRGDGAAVLTGVLVDAVISPDAQAPLPAELGNGGFSSGGRSPGSFGGSDTSGRIGTGGRY